MTKKRTLRAHERAARKPVSQNESRYAQKQFKNEGDYVPSVVALPPLAPPMLVAERVQTKVDEVCFANGYIFLRDTEHRRIYLQLRLWKLFKSKHFIRNGDLLECMIAYDPRGYRVTQILGYIRQH